jgi:hypothetical protein
MHTTSRWIAGVTVVVFLGALLSRWVFAELPSPAGTLCWKLSWLLLCGLGLAVAHRIGPRGWPAELGLRAPWGRALAVALAASLPMLVSLGIAGGLALEISAGALAMTAIVSPLTEEVLFRGYVIRQLHRRAGWSFGLAVAVSAVVFGLAHLGSVLESGDFTTLALQVGITGVGGLFFGWLFVRSGDNLWLPIAMHALMNLWWALFAVDETAVGNAAANVGRVLTVVAALVLVSYAFPRPPASDEPSAAASPG